MRKSKLNCRNAYLLQDEKWLRFHYIEKDMSLRLIGNLIPCSALTIRRALAKYNISIKPKHITYGDIKYPPRSGENSPTWKGGKHHCPDCNIEIGYRYSKNGEKVKCKSCASKYYRGKQHHSWKPADQCVGGEVWKIRNSIEYKEWRIKVWSRDKTKCRVCGIRKDPMVAHHLDGFNIFPEKRFDVDNGVTLCDRHHIAFHTNYGFGNNTKSQFEEYLATTTEVTY
jgi:hypothetical protein